MFGPYGPLSSSNPGSVNQVQTARRWSLAGHGRLRLRLGRGLRLRLVDAGYGGSPLNCENSIGPRGLGTVTFAAVGPRVHGGDRVYHRNPEHAGDLLDATARPAPRVRHHRGSVAERGAIRLTHTDSGRLACQDRVRVLQRGRRAEKPPTGSGVAAHAVAVRCRVPDPAHQARARRTFLNGFVTASRPLPPSDQLLGPAPDRPEGPAIARRRTQPTRSPACLHTR